jgi:hypothetical protein
MKIPLLAAAALLALALPAPADEPARLEFEPRVGATGTRVVLSGPYTKGAEVRYAGKPVAVLEEPGKHPSILIPVGAGSAFLEVVSRGKVLARSSVPFIVSGPSIVTPQKLLGLKEAIDVFGYSEPIPEGGQKPPTNVKPLLMIDDSEVLTIGDRGPPPPFQPAVELGDLASAFTRSMGTPLIQLTGRMPRRRLVIPYPTPVPTPAPGTEETPNP